MEISRAKNGSTMLFFTLIVYSCFNFAMPRCNKYKDCKTCTTHRTWTGGPCRWCPLDHACHANWSPKNPCLKRQNLKAPSLCVPTTTNSVYSPYDAYKLAIFSAIAYSDEPDKCLEALFSDDDFVTESIVSVDCDGILFNYKKCVAFIVVSDDRKEIIVSYRGTRGYKQILDEILSIISVPKVRSTVGGKTQHYFEKVYHRLYSGVKSVLNKLLQTHPGYSISLTGHSLGGAVASITSAALIKDNITTSENLFLYTFGMPRVGNKIYAESHDKLVQNSWRVVRKGDRVTGLPRCILAPCTIFNGPYHHGKKVLYDGHFMSVKSNFTICHGSDDSNSKCKKRRSKRGVVGDLLDTHKHYFGIPIGTYCRDYILKNTSSN